MQVKCKLCGTTHEKTESYSPTGKSPYYCSKEEYEEEQVNQIMRKSTFTLLHDDILNYDERQIVVNKKLEQLGKSYGWEIVFKTFKHCENDIKFWIQQKNFDNEYLKINYIMAIITNHINDIYIKYKNEKRQKKENNIYIDIDILNDDFVPNSKNTNDISQFL